MTIKRLVSETKETHCVGREGRRLVKGCGYTEPGWRENRLERCPQCENGRLHRVTVRTESVAIYGRGETCHEGDEDGGATAQGRPGRRSG